MSIKSALSALFSKATADLDAIRAEIAEVAGQIAEVEAAPRPYEDAAKLVRAHVRRHRSDRIPMSEFLRSNSPAPGIFQDDVQPLDLIIKVVGADAYEAALLRNLRAEYETAEAEGLRPVSDADRKAKLADLRARLHSLEMQEEAYVADASAAGIDVLRRPDADPAIVLAVK